MDFDRIEKIYESIENKTINQRKKANRNNKNVITKYYSRNPEILKNKPECNEMLLDLKEEDTNNIRTYNNIYKNDPTDFLEQEQHILQENEQKKNIIKNKFAYQFDEIMHDYHKPPVSKDAVISHLDDIKSINRYFNISKGKFSCFNSNIIKPTRINENVQLKITDHLVPNINNGMRTGSYQKTDDIDRKLEIFTGKTDVTTRAPKTPVGKFFPYETGKTNDIYGTKIYNDDIKERFNKSKERRNEKPFYEKRIQPGLNLNYDDCSKHGFHDTFRVIPPTVNDLRPKSRPKVEYRGIVIPGKKGNKATKFQKHIKKRRTKCRKRTSADNIPSSTIKKPMLKSKVDPKIPMKSISNENKIFGAKSIHNKNIANSKYIPDTTMKECIENSKHPYNITSINKKNNIINEKSVPNPTLKDILHNIFNGILGNTKNSSVIINNNDVPSTTIKETTSKNINNGHKGGQYKTNTITNQEFDPTIKETTSKNINKGHKGGQYKTNTITNQEIDPTIKEITSKNINKGHKGGQYKTNTITNQEIDPTIKDIILKNIITNLKPNSNKTSSALTTILDSTLKEIVENNNILLNIKGEKKTVSINNNDIPNITLKDILLQYIQTNITGNKIKPTIIPDEFDITLKDIIMQYTQQHSNIKSTNMKNHVYSDNYISDVTLRDIISTYFHANINGNIKSDKNNTNIIYNNNLDTTLKEISSRCLQMHIGNNIKKVRENTYIDIPNITLADILNNSDIISGNINNIHKTNILNTDDIPNLTLKELILNNNITTSNINNNKKSCTINYDDIPNITLKELLVKSLNVSGVKGNIIKSIIHTKDIPELTLKDIILNHKQNISNVKHNIGEQISHYADNNTVLPINRELLIYNRDPNKVGANINYHSENIGNSTKCKKMSETINIMNAPSNTSQHSINNNVIHTRPKINYEISNYVDKTVLDQLHNNPYVNNCAKNNDNDTDFEKSLYNITT